MGNNKAVLWIIAVVVAAFAFAIALGWANPPIAATPEPALGVVESESVSIIAHRGETVRNILTVKSLRATAWGRRICSCFFEPIPCPARRFPPLTDTRNVLYHYVQHEPGGV